MGRRMSVPDLIGRQVELATLGNALAEVGSGSGRVALVEGDAGVGKTRLVQEFTSRARDSGATVLAGGCLQLEAAIPYAAFIEALRPIHEPGDPFSDPADRSALFRQVAGEIVDAARGNPTVVIIEDLHWADASTRDLFAYLNRAVSASPVLLVATTRRDEVSAEHEVAALIAELGRSPRTERIAVEPFARPEVVELIRGILGIEPPPGLVDAVLSRAEGNPFFTEELVAAWPATDEVPRTVREVVVTRLARLSDDARSLARLAAVVGRAVPQGLLDAVAGMPPDRVDAASRSLVDHGQLVIVDADSYAFRHALIQETLYRDLLPGERRTSHERIAQVLAETPALAVSGSASGAAAELAHHWDLAARPAEALVASVDAAAAAAGYAPVEAHEHYELAIRCFDDTADAEALIGFNRDALLERAAAVAGLAAHNARAVELTQLRLAHLDELADRDRVALAHSALSQYAWRAGDEELAQRAIDRALELAPSGSPARLSVLARNAAQHMLASRYRAAVKAADELLPLARAAGDETTIDHALLVLATAHLVLGHVEQGLAYGREQLEMAVRARRPGSIGAGYLNLSEMLVCADRVGEGLTLAREGLRLADEYGFELYRQSIVGDVVRALAELGQWDEALAPVIDVRDDPAADPFNSVPADLPRAELHLRRGDVAAAGELVARCEAALAGHRSGQYLTELAGVRAQHAAAEGRFDDARAAVVEGLRITGKADEQHRTARLVAIGVRVEADAIDDARAAGRAVDPAASRSSAGALLATAEQCRVELEGDGAVALPRTARSMALARAERTRLDDGAQPDAWAAVVDVAAHDRYLAGYAHFRHAEALLLARGSRTAARAALIDATAIAADLGAGPLRHDIEALAARARLELDATASTDGAGTTADTDLGLTAREAEVLVLVGRGLTNQQIATQLFISTKTASVHVSNILRKLGLTSRIQAGALAQRRDSTPAPTPAPAQGD